MKTKTITIWTSAYRPFILGGDVNAPVGIDLEVGKPVSLGKGYFGYVITSPNGKTYIVEKTTGGIVGDRLEDVRRDVQGSRPAFLKQQIKEQKARAKTVVRVSVDEFWKLVEGR